MYNILHFVLFRHIFQWDILHIIKWQTDRFSVGLLGKKKKKSNVCSGFLNDITLCSPFSFSTSPLENKNHKMAAHFPPLSNNSCQNKLRFQLAEHIIKQFRHVALCGCANVLFIYFYTTVSWITQVKTLQVLPLVADFVHRNAHVNTIRSTVHYLHESKDFTCSNTSLLTCRYQQIF